MIAGEYRFDDLGRISVIVGKNGCGKSQALRALDSSGSLASGIGLAKAYVTPERGGSVKYNPNVELNMGVASNYVTDSRRRNQSTEFKPQSAAHFRKLSTKVLLKLNASVGSVPEDQLASLKLDPYIAEINSLLDHVWIEPDDTTFSIRLKPSGQIIEADNISSGESELISLAIESLSFEALNGERDNALLILDEPDAHLHPDLQVRLVNFLRNICDRSRVKIILSTHSSPVLSALSDYEHGKIFFMRRNDKILKFENISHAVKAMLPVFGAHPLTSVFNHSPVFLVEGTDEERIWQQAVRTSQGKLKIYPVVCGDITELGKYEADANLILGSVYDGAKGYSLRDGDGVMADLDDLGAVVRFRLQCYSSENLLITDEVLLSVGKKWDDLKASIEEWIQGNPTHQYIDAMKAFKEGNYDRKNSRLKDIRNILASFMSNKAWEVVVGQVIGRLKVSSEQQFNVAGSIYSYLGEKLCSSILKN